ncbi:sugar phosphate isomerase/epimerase family protein [Mucilaginibacter lacusdianchii]|uniref:sugar phosphate isomerase/epimerase family protein n=1 Tax=Mucilaginibacter lacusdianchii TaxID=2684211 RepID=UPI00131B1B0D|nr:sugar phosphate isomerase/epimerase [Mucilaginibacter sp. JXJ CY 39]
MTTRRTFLTQAGMLSAAALLAPNILSAKGASKTGLQLFTLREQLPKDVKGTIAKVAAAGYGEVETFGYSKDNGYWGLKLPEFNALLTSHGLTTPSGHYGMDSVLADDKYDQVKLGIEAANALGQTYFTIPYVDQRFRKTADDLKRLAEKINKTAEVCKEAGLKTAYHNHNFEFETVDGTTFYDVLLKEGDPKLLNFELDLYWVVRAGKDPVTLFNQHPGRFAMVHVKDMNKTKRELNTEVGTGSIDYKTIVAKAKQSGVQHFIMEQENFTNIDPYVSIGKSLNYMKNVLHV